MLSIGLKFSPGQPVKVLALNVTGYVEAVVIRRGNVTDYDVTYWFNGIRTTVCVTEGEINAL